MRFVVFDELFYDRGLIAKSRPYDRHVKTYETIMMFFVENAHFNHKFSITFTIERKYDTIVLEINVNNKRKVMFNDKI